MIKWKELIKFKGDKILWCMIILLMVASVLLIYSSTGRLAYNKQDGNTLFYVGKQLTFLIVCFGVLFVTQIFSWKKLYEWAPWLLLGAGILLVMAAFGGDNINGAGRWIKIPILGVTFQPSEFAKIAIVIYVSKLFADYQEEHWCSNEILKQLWAPALVILLIFLDNFSTSVLISAVCLALFILGRMRLGLLLKIIGCFVAVMTIILVLGIMVPQSRNWGRIGTIVSRLTEFVVGGDSNEERKKDYSMQADHARMAIAQGGLTGRGPGNSIQRNMLPHAYSDFIYAILIEEYSFFGGLIVMILYLIILYRSVRICQNALKIEHLNPRGQPNIFPALLVFGLGLSITLQALFHMGVNTGALPVTGQTLPLISLGGTSLLFTSAALGIMLNVAYTVSPERQKRESMDHSCYNRDEEFSYGDPKDNISELGELESEEIVKDDFENEGDRMLREFRKK